MMIKFVSKHVDSDKVREKLVDVKGQSITRIHVECPPGKTNEKAWIVKELSALGRVTTEDSPNRKLYKTSVHTTSLKKGRH